MKYAMKKKTGKKKVKISIRISCYTVWIHSISGVHMNMDIRVICPIILSKFLIILLCECACVWKPVNEETIELGAGYRRNQGPESVWFVRLFQGIWLGHHMPSFRFHLGWETDIPKFFGNGNSYTVNVKSNRQEKPPHFFPGHLRKIAYKTQP